MSAATRHPYVRAVAATELARLAADHGIRVETHTFDDGQTTYLTGGQSGLSMAFTRHWGEAQTSTEAALAALTTALERA
jgi:hypothetical protein